MEYQPFEWEKTRWLRPARDVLRYLKLRVVYTPAGLLTLNAG